MLLPTPAHLDLRTAEFPLQHKGLLRAYTLPWPRTALWRFLHHKRWGYLWVDGENWILGMAIIDLGYLTKSFVFFVEAEQKTPVFYREALALPGISPVLHSTQEQLCTAKFHGQALHSRIQWFKEGILNFQVEGKNLSISGQAQRPEQAPLVAANLLPGGSANLTMKTMRHSAQVRIRFQNREWKTAHAWVATDLTDGFLPRSTRWSWASLSGLSLTGERVSLNLVEGFNGACECLLWVNDLQIPLEEGVIEGQAPDQNWQIRTRCGKVQLEFQPWCALWDQTRLGLVSSDFRQVYGTYSGRITTGQNILIIEKLRGIAEYQAVLW